MNEIQTAKQTVVEICQKLIQKGILMGTGGNVSVRVVGQKAFAITPSNYDYAKMTVDDICVLGWDMSTIEGKRKPSVESSMHAAIYEHRLDTNCVIHTHQVYATTIACMNWELPAVHYLVGFSGNKVPLAKYATFGSQELCDNIVSAIGNYNACLMANHGIVTVGQNILSAFNTAEELELVSRLYYQTKCIGEPVILGDDEMKIIGEKFKTYGQQ